jgi:hypothetical protein
MEGRWSGHSLRRGFTTAARRAGHDKIRTAPRRRPGRRLPRPRRLHGRRRPHHRPPLVNIGL